VYSFGPQRIKRVIRLCYPVEIPLALCFDKRTWPNRTQHSFIGTGLEHPSSVSCTKHCNVTNMVTCSIILQTISLSPLPPCNIEQIHTMSSDHQHSGSIGGDFHTPCS